MSGMFVQKHEDILNQYSKIWNKIKDLIEKDFDVEVIHNEMTNVYQLK